MNPRLKLIKYACILKDEQLIAFVYTSLEFIAEGQINFSAPLSTSVLCILLFVAKWD